MIAGPFQHAREAERRALPGLLRRRPHDGKQDVRRRRLQHELPFRAVQVQRIDHGAAEAQAGIPGAHAQRDGAGFARVAQREEGGEISLQAQRQAVIGPLGAEPHRLVQILGAEGDAVEPDMQPVTGGGGDLHLAIGQGEVQKHRDARPAGRIDRRQSLRPAPPRLRGRLLAGAAGRLQGSRPDFPGGPPGGAP